jgi:hypothetical protein
LLPADIYVKVVRRQEVDEGRDKLKFKVTIWPPCFEGHEFASEMKPIVLWVYILSNLQLKFIQFVLVSCDESWVHINKFMMGVVTIHIDVNRLLFLFYVHYYSPMFDAHLRVFDFNA